MPKVSFTFRGLIAPVFTPFNNDSTRTLNLSIIPQYGEFLAKKGITGILVNGTTGEGPSMSASERKSVAEAWANVTKRTKQHLMIQVGGAPLPDVLELAKHAESIKADSILCLPELYFKPKTSDDLRDYLKMVSSAAPNTPLLYYHFPDMSNVTIHMGRFLEQCGDQIPTFVGIKFTSPNLEEGAQALRANKSKFVVCLGNDQLINPGCALGMDTFITTSLNMLSELGLETLAEGKAGNVSKGREKQQHLTSIVVAIAKYGNWVETMKVAMALLTNINPGPPRAPSKPLTAQVTASMAKDLQYLGLQVKM
ncbi:N-acetylneuraminate lyase-like [Xylocopa sonorina]|uniref:N-acetylneuraminate lyase-like n=1 Tax=Xylocopa sonorina TaxID=1818115 RepID=UPI00403AE471